MPQIFVFSDDIAWCRETFAAPDFAFVDSNGPDDAADDLRLMAACRHHVIANSSLSWWGAWLAAASGAGRDCAAAPGCLDAGKLPTCLQALAYAAKSLNKS